MNHRLARAALTALALAPFVVACGGSTPPAESPGGGEPPAHAPAPASLSEADCRSDLAAHGALCAVSDDAKKANAAMAADLCPKAPSTPEIAAWVSCFSAVKSADQCAPKADECGPLFKAMVERNKK